MFQVDEAPFILQQLDGGLLTRRGGDGGDDVIQAFPPQLGLAVVDIGLTAARSALRRSDVSRCSVRAETS